jgi:hypothetical protein
MGTSTSAVVGTLFLLALAALAVRHLLFGDSGSEQAKSRVPGDAAKKP